MFNIIIQLSKYLLIILAVLYSFQCFTVFKRKNEERKKKILGKQFSIIIVMMCVGYLDIFLYTYDLIVLVLLLCSCLYFIVLRNLYKGLYPKSSMLVVNNMCMLLGIGFLILTRLDIESSIKQLLIAAIASAIALFVPVIIRKLRFLSKLRWIYAIVGIACLGVVLVLAATSGGAKLSITIAGISFQFSEIVKITYVFYIAASLQKNHSFANVVVTTCVAAAHVMILVLSTDLGTGLVFFVTYLVMLYVATRKVSYSLVGLGGGAVASVAAYHLFGHVRKRVDYWKDPFADYEHAYQIVQGMFAVGAGGWFGTGLCQGSPNIIPLATNDYVFTAICEELGGIFGICIILICMSMFLMIVNISMKIRNPFYKLIALGLGTEYAFQVFLTIGGTIKFIPMTGITLPLVSYGGSSVMSTIIMLAIVQGLYILREDEDERIKQERERAMERAMEREREEFERREYERNEEIRELKRQERAIVEAGGLGDYFEDTRKW